MNFVLVTATELWALRWQDIKGHGDKLQVRVFGKPTSHPGRRLAVVDMTERTGRLLRASRLDRALVLPQSAVADTVSAVTA